MLTEATKGEQFANFTWTAADFGFDAAVSYKLELDVAGNNFANPKNLGVTSGLVLEKVTKNDVNSFIYDRGLPGEVPVDLEVRLVATVSSQVDPVYSSPVIITVTPFTVLEPHLRVPGAYQGWDLFNSTTVVYSPEDNGKYEGYVYFGEDNTTYKYVQGTTWDVNWGDNGNDGSLEPGGGDITAGPKGLYKLNVDLNDNVHSALRTDWGLIGSALPDDWNTDQDMTFDPATNTWSITLDLTGEELKFRANDDWAVNLGDDSADGNLEYNGANIVISEAGNYTIELNLSKSKYKYKVTKN